MNSKTETRVLKLIALVMAWLMISLSIPYSPIINFGTPAVEASTADCTSKGGQCVNPVLSGISSNYYFEGWTCASPTDDPAPRCKIPDSTITNCNDCVGQAGRMWCYNLQGETPYGYCSNACTGLASSYSIATSSQQCQNVPVASGGSGNTASKTITVSCTPTTTEAGQSVFCTASAIGCTPASNGWTWHTSGASNSAGSSSSASLSWSTAGTKYIYATNNACSGASTPTTLVTVNSAGSNNNGRSVVIQSPAANSAQTSDFQVRIRDTGGQTGTRYCFYQVWLEDTSLPAAYANRFTIKSNSFLNSANNGWISRECGTTSGDSYVTIGVGPGELCDPSLSSRCKVVAVMSLYQTPLLQPNYETYNDERIFNIGTDTDGGSTTCGGSGQICCSTTPRCATGTCQSNGRCPVTSGNPGGNPNDNLCTSQSSFGVPNTCVASPISGVQRGYIFSPYLCQSPTSLCKQSDSRISNCLSCMNAGYVWCYSTTANTGYCSPVGHDTVDPNSGGCVGLSQPSPTANGCSAVPIASGGGVYPICAGDDCPAGEVCGIDLDAGGLRVCVSSTTQTPNTAVRGSYPFCTTPGSSSGCHSGETCFGPISAIGGLNVCSSTGSVNTGATSCSSCLTTPGNKWCTTSTPDATNGACRLITESCPTTYSNTVGAFCPTDSGTCANGACSGQNCDNTNRCPTGYGCDSAMGQCVATSNTCSGGTSNCDRPAEDYINCASQCNNFQGDGVCSPGESSTSRDCSSTGTGTCNACFQNQQYCCMSSVNDPNNGVCVGYTQDCPSGYREGIAVSQGAYSTVLQNMIRCQTNEECGTAKTCRLQVFDGGLQASVCVNSNNRPVDRNGNEVDTSHITNQQYGTSNACTAACQRYAQSQNTQISDAFCWQKMSGRPPTVPGYLQPWSPGSGQTICGANDLSCWCIIEDPRYSSVGTAISGFRDAVSTYVQATQQGRRHTVTPELSRVLPDGEAYADEAVPRADPENNMVCEIGSRVTIDGTVGDSDFENSPHLYAAGSNVVLTGSVESDTRTYDGYNYSCRRSTVTNCRIYNNVLYSNYLVNNCPHGYTMREDIGTGDRHPANTATITVIIGLIAYVYFAGYSLNSIITAVSTMAQLAAGSCQSYASTIISAASGSLGCAKPVSALRQATTAAISEINQRRNEVRNRHGQEPVEGQNEQTPQRDQNAIRDEIRALCRDCVNSGEFYCNDIGAPVAGVGVVGGCTDHTPGGWCTLDSTECNSLTYSPTGSVIASQAGSLENTETSSVPEGENKITGQATNCVGGISAAGWQVIFSAAAQLAVCIDSHTSEDDAMFCYGVCSKDYNPPVGPGSENTNPCGSGDNVYVTHYEPQQYTSQQTTCGGLADASVTVSVYDPTGRLVSSGTTSTDSTGSFMYSFPAPNADGRSSVILTTPVPGTG